MGRRDLEDWFYETYRRDLEEMARRVYREDSSLSRAGYAEEDFIQDAYEEMVKRRLKAWIRRFWWQSVLKVKERWKAGKRQRPRQVPMPEKDLCVGGNPAAAHRWDQIDRLVAQEKAEGIEFANRWKG